MKNNKFLANRKLISGETCETNIDYNILYKDFVKFKLLTENAQIPAYAHNGDLGVDIIPVSVEYDKEKDRYIYHSGLAIESNVNIGCFAMPQSRNVKTEFYLANSVGLIDSFLYRGEICFVYKNRTNIKDKIFKSAFKKYIKLPWYKRLFNGCKYWNDIYKSVEKFEIEYALYDAPYKVGESCGQLVFYINPKIDIIKADELTQTERGTGGFGSTEKQK